MELVIFYIFGLLAVLAALGVVSLRNPVHSALSLAVVFIALAAMYVMLDAPFIAVAQVMVYAGAIMMLILFVIMLVNLEQDSAPERKFSSRKFVGAIITIMLFFEILVIATAFQVTGREAIYTPGLLQSTGNVKVVGGLLYGQYLFPFELASVLLLIGIVGAVVLAKKRKDE